MILFYWVIAGLSHILPRNVALFITYRIADLMYITLYRHRLPIVYKNLDMLYGFKIPLWRKKRLALRIYRNFARFIYEFLLLPRIRDEKVLATFVEYSEDYKIRQLVERGESVIVLTAHLGNWELGATMLAVKGYKPIVIALRPRSKLVAQFFTRRRLKAGMEVLYLGEPMFVAIKGLRANRVVATLGDRDYVGDGIEMDFLAGRTVFPRGIFELAYRTGAYIAPAFCLHQNRARYFIYFETPYKVGDVESGIRRWVEILANYIRKSPTEWYVFDMIWRKH